MMDILSFLLEWQTPESLLSMLIGAFVPMSRDVMLYLVGTVLGAV